MRSAQRAGPWDERRARGQAQGHRGKCCPGAPSTETGRKAINLKASRLAQPLILRKITLPIVSFYLTSPTKLVIPKLRGRSFGREVEICGSQG